MTRIQLSNITPDHDQLSTGRQHKNSRLRLNGSIPFGFWPLGNTSPFSEFKSKGHHKCLAPIKSNAHSGPTKARTGHSVDPMPIKVFARHELGKCIFFWRLSCTMLDPLWLEA